MEAKAKEFNEVLQEQYYPWFAQYMVMKRYHTNLSPFYFCINYSDNDELLNYMFILAGQASNQIFMTCI